MEHTVSNMVMRDEIEDLGLVYVSGVRSGMEYTVGVA